METAGMTTIWGIVKDGLIVPQAPVPEGARVQILLPTESPELPPDMQTEFDAWSASGAAALEAFEQQLEKEAGDAQG
jgi:hypothetical protein